MRKRKGRFARLVTVFLALLVALALTGMGYGIWSDTISIEGAIEMGVSSYILTATDNYTSPSGGSVTCYEDSGALEVTVISANVTYQYYGDFNIENTGSLPLKMVVDPSTVPPKVGAEIIIDAPGDGVIDPLETEYGRVRVYLTESTTPPQGSTFTVVTNVVLWNE